MIRVPSDGLSLCTDMVRIGNSVEKLHGSLIRMGYHPYDEGCRWRENPGALALG
jgi:hypothetical protein